MQAKFGDPPEDPPPTRPPEHVSMSAEDFEDEPEPEADASAQQESAPESQPAAHAEDEADSMEVEQEPTAYTGENGSLQFVIPRRANALFLRFLLGDARCFVTCSGVRVTCAARIICGDVPVNGGAPVSSS